MSGCDYLPYLLELIVYFSSFKNTGELTDPCNYPPINIVIILGNIIEPLINVEFIQYLSSQDPFSDNQYSYHFSRSTVYLLMTTEEIIYPALDKISKAFDRALHSCPHHKLKVTVSTI